MKGSSKYQALGFWAKYPEQMNQIYLHFEEQEDLPDGAPKIPAPPEVAELLEGHEETAYRIYELACSEANALVLKLCQKTSEILTVAEVAQSLPKKNTENWSSSNYIRPIHSTIDIRDGLHIGYDIGSTDSSQGSLEVFTWLWLNNDKMLTEELRRILHAVGMHAVSAKQIISHWERGCLILKRHLLTPDADDFSLNDESIIHEATSPFVMGGLSKSTLIQILDLR